MGTTIAARADGQRHTNATTSARSWWIGIAIFLALSVGATIFIAAITGDPANTGIADGAAVLAFVTGIALGVERLIEVVWAWVDKSEKKGAWWPLSLVTDAMSEMETKTNEALTPFVQDVASLLVDLDGWVGDSAAKAEAVNSVAADIEERAAAAREAIAHAQKLAPGSSRFAAIARATDDFTHDAEVIAKKAGVWSRDLERHLRSAGDVLTSAHEVVGAFTSNPARTTMSIALGVPMAILASGVLGLNMFAAVLGPDVPPYMAGVLGILATGVVMGLGSNPTHEVINALQRRKGDATIEVPVGSADQEMQVGTIVEGDDPATDVAERVASLRDFETETVRNLLAVRQLMTAPAVAPAPRPVYVSRRRVRPIRNTG
ncbi:hypothetical protein [Ilumatobacter nonamiensis]|uniref:hypothetical protein n=1 Tax=Ilumatobacter nonamiensis TaxID=467093 RepID=UPI000348C31F|nr:hypothetical protein [Ilumatobacter nonamiensis]